MSNESNYCALEIELDMACAEEQYINKRSLRWSTHGHRSSQGTTEEHVEENLMEKFHMIQTEIKKARDHVGYRALRRCYFIGGGAPVDLGRRRLRAPARRPRLIGGGVAGKHRRWRRLVINYWKLATTNNKQCTMRLSSIIVLWNYFQKKTNNKRKLLLLFAAFQTELRRPYIHLII